MSSKLHKALRTIKEQIEIASNLIVKGVNVNVKDTVTPLHLAVETENVKIIKLLLKAGADTNSKDVNENTPLHVAVRVKNINILQLLLEAGANVNAKNCLESTPLHSAVNPPLGTSVDVNILKILLEAGADVNAKEYDEFTPLHAVLESGFSDVKILKLLLDAGANVNEKNNYQQTPLHLIEFERLDVLRLLLETKADVNAIDFSGETPLHYAVQSVYDVSALKLLLEAGADINARNISLQTPLHKAVTEDFDICKFLVEAGADIMAKNIRGETPLHQVVASEKADVNIVKFLLEAGADVNDKDSSLHTPMHIAAGRKNLKILEFLLAAGADVNVKDRWGNPPFQEAAEDCLRANANVEVLKLLLDAGADVNSKNNGDFTALHRISYEDEDVLKFLLEAGADVNAKCFDGNTPLCEVLEFRPIHVNFLELLLSAGANVNEVNEAGNSALSILIRSLESGRKNDERILMKECAEFLIEYTNVNLTDAEGRNILAKILDSDSLLIYRKYFYKIIIKHVAKLKILNIDVDESLMEVISQVNDYNNYFMACVQELEKAKNTKLYKCWVTFFNLLVDDKSKFVKYAANEDLIQDFERKVQMFSIYGPMIKSNVSKGIDGRKLIDGTANILSYYCPIFDRTHLIIKDIIDILSKDDWKKLNEKKSK